MLSKTLKQKFSDVKDSSENAINSNEYAGESKEKAKEVAHKVMCDIIMQYNKVLLARFFTFPLPIGIENLKLLLTSVMSKMQ